jgi:Asp-tRNA(Asn)/Glu-tRNA(Gln) amidotransferase A subunit family amidase
MSPRDDVAPLRMTLAEAVAAIDAGAVTARALAEAGLARIAATEPAIHAWAHLDPGAVRAAADRSDAAKTAAPLRGIGVGVKDIIDTAGLPTQLGTPIYAGRQPARSAACVQRLEAAGAYVLGKTVTTAFAFLDAGPTCNPWDAQRTPGGSSSGSAAAVAAGHATAAIGTQTNGSVIRPASFCGVVGFKPTFGAIDFTGAHVFSETLDTLGTFTRTVADAARVAAALATGRRIGSEPAAAERAPRVAYLSTFPWVTLEPGTDDAVAAAAVALRRAGAIVTPAGYPDAWRDAHRVHRTIMLYEGARSLGAVQARHRDRISAQTNAALDEGHAVAEADYRAALAARARAIAYFEEWLAPYDAVLAPSAPGAAPKGLGWTGDPGCCTLWSLVGFPAVSLPLGLDAEGLPLGLQLAARTHADDALLGVAAWCEDVLGFGARIAPVAATPP